MKREQVKRKPKRQEPSSHYGRREHMAGPPALGTLPLKHRPRITAGFVKHFNNESGDHDLLDKAYSISLCVYVDYVEADLASMAEFVRVTFDRDRPLFMG